MSTLLPQNINGISTLQDLTCQAFQQILQNFFQTQDVQIENSSCDFEDFVGNNDFLNSQIKKIQIKAKIDGKLKVLPMVIKIPPNTAFAKKMSSGSKVFMKEKAWYTRMAPEMGRALSPELGDILPTMYFACSNYDKYAFTDPPLIDRLPFPFPLMPGRKNEVGFLMMENLEERPNENYKVIDKNKILPLAHVKTALQALAHLHGASWQVLHDKVDPEKKLSFTGEDVRKMLKMRIPFFLIKSMVRKAVALIINMMKSRNEDQELIERVQHWRDNVLCQKMKTLLAADMHKDSKIGTIIHGDFWSNNMMFHENLDDGSLKVKFLDLQMTGLNHPACDIGYFLYIGTDWAFRKAHLIECLEHYFDTFSSYLKPSGLNYSFEDFFQDYNERRHSYVMGLMVMTNVLYPYEIKFNTFSDINEMIRKKEEYLCGPDKDDDHPMIKEMRRRLLDAMHEYAEEKVF